MNNKENQYTDFSICREMLETADVMRNFKSSSVDPFLPLIRDNKRILFTGEGSSRIFPAKRTLAERNRSLWKRELFTEGSTQALEYNLNECAVLGASNSGQTKETVRLFQSLRKNSEPYSIPLVGITANHDTLLESASDRTYILSCGKEQAIAATKSVAEQALFYQALLYSLEGTDLEGLEQAADEMILTLEQSIDPFITKKLADAPQIYFAGRNDGVSEELALKTNEITRKPSAYLEGTFALHGIEEVMSAEEVLILINPFPEEYEKYQKCLEKGVGLTIIAVSENPTPFHTIQIPSGGIFRNYIELAAGWNLLVEAGLACDVNLDKPKRARKVGNQF